jgi:UTP-glucose-1-phosphate uridylyltransferase
MAVGLLPAAGLASRLGIATPKELVVHRGRPVIDHSVAHLAASGVDTVVLVTRRGKEQLLDYLRATWPAITFVAVRQSGPFGALTDALRCAAPLLGGHEVKLLFPDTFLQPNPFLAMAPTIGAPPGPVSVEQLAGDVEILLLCHDAGERWRHFGVVDVARRRVVEKPDHHLGSTWCWGAAWWTASFTERLVQFPTITDAINAAAWHAECPIQQYEDIGLPPGLAPP